MREAFDARVLRPAEIERLIAASTSTYRNAVIVMGYSGLRVSELAGLTWADIDLVDWVVRVDRQLAPLRRGVEPRRVRPKSRASVREVPLLDRAYEAGRRPAAGRTGEGLGERVGLRLHVAHRTTARARPSFQARSAGSGDEGGPRACHRTDAPPFGSNGHGACTGPFGSNGHGACTGSSRSGSGDHRAQPSGLLRALRTAVQACRRARKGAEVAGFDRVR